MSRPPCELPHLTQQTQPFGATLAYFSWVADGRPWQFARPVLAVANKLRQHGYTVYMEGDERHLQKDTPEDHTPFSETGWPGASPYPVCMALDVMPPTAGQTSKLTGRPLPSLAALAAQLRRDRINGHPGAAWVKYMNWEPEGNFVGPCYHDTWQPDYVRYTSGDRGHIHGSCRTDYAASGVADGYDLVDQTEGSGGMTILGWDLSHYDAPDSRRAVDEGVTFLTHKAGGDADDAELAAWWSYMKDYRDRVLLGAYWVQYPGNPVGRADAFIARLDSQCPGWRDGPFILQDDCEIWGGNTSTKPNRAEIEAFCDRLVYRMPKLWPIVYAPEWAYHNELAGLSYPLWASSYVSGTGSAATLYPGDGSTRWHAYSGKTPAILQFSSSATIAGQTTCDANAYRGTLAQLTALVAPGWSDHLVTSQAEFDKLMTTWWNTNMTPQSASNSMRSALRIAAWQQSVGRTTISTHNMLFGEMRAALAQITAQIDAILAKLVVDPAALAAARADIDATVSQATRAIFAELAAPGDDDEAATGGEATGDDDEAATRAAREQAQQRIQGSGA
jgi:hypothetical protein